MGIGSTVQRFNSFFFLETFFRLAGVEGFMSVLTTKGWVKARLDVVHERLDEMKAENAALALCLGERASANRKDHEE